MRHKVAISYVSAILNIVTTGDGYLKCFKMELFALVCV